MLKKKKWRVRPLDLLEIPDTIRNHDRYNRPDGLEYDSARITEDGRYVRLTFEDGSADMWGLDPKAGKWVCLNDHDIDINPPDLSA